MILRSRISSMSFGATILLASLCPPVVGQNAVLLAPRVLIEGFHSNDALSLQAAGALRSALSSRVDSATLRVMSTKEIDDQRNVGLPDDFGAAWSMADLREVSRAYRVQVIIDIAAGQSHKGITLHASRMRPARSGALVALSPVHAPTLNAAISLLVSRLVADTILLRKVSAALPDT